MILGIVGKKGSGKTTVAKLLESEYGFKPIAFADAIKEAAAHAFNIPLSVSNDPILKDNMQISVNLSPDALYAFLWHLSSKYEPIHPSLIEEVVGLYSGPFNMQTPRQLLQVLGTDLVRNYVDEEYWLKAVRQQMREPGNYVIHDVRFENEANYIKTNLNGNILVVSRLGLQNTDGHISEQFSPTSYDSLIQNDGSLQELYSKVDSALKALYNGSKV